MEWAEFRIKQDGMIVASTSGPANSAEAEIMHYAMLYADEGDLAVEVKDNGRWKTHLKMKQSND